MLRPRTAKAMVKLWRAWSAVGLVPLWLRKAVRVVSVGKAAVKWALTWLAKGWAAG